MREVLHSVRRIAIAVGTVTLGLLLGFAWLIRQPNFGLLPFPGDGRADAALLEAHVRYLAAPEKPRNWRHPDSLERAAAYIAAAFARTRGRCSEQRFRAGTINTRNLIAAFGPATGGRIVVGAHYDVFGELPGADDNASGVAGLLELARLLDTHVLASPVELVAYSTEEPPFFGGAEMGSAVHARSLEQSGAQVRAMIAVEMIGYYTTSQPNRALLLHLVYPRRGDFVSLVGRWPDRHLVRQAKKAFRGATRVPVVSYSGPVVIGADLSDHRNYWLAGYPAFMVTDTAYLRNPNYHTDADIAASLDYRAMAGVVDGLLSAVVHLAND